MWAAMPLCPVLESQPERLQDQQVERAPQRRPVSSFGTASLRSLCKTNVPADSASQIESLRLSVSKARNRAERRRNDGRAKGKAAARRRRNLMRPPVGTRDADGRDSALPCEQHEAACSKQDQGHEERDERFVSIDARDGIHHGRPPDRAIGAAHHGLQLNSNRSTRKLFCNRRSSAPDKMDRVRPVAGLLLIDRVRSGGVSGATVDFDRASASSPSTRARFVQRRVSGARPESGGVKKDAAA